MNFHTAVDSVALAPAAPGASSPAAARPAARPGWLRGMLGLALATLCSVVTPALAAPSCGPGAHWVDACPGGIDYFSLTEGIHTIQIGGGVYQMQSSGPTTVWRGNGMTLPDHHIDTELVSMSLTGGGLTLTAGDGVADGLCSGPFCSMGRITEQGGNPLLANSFFDVFFEITGPALGPLGPLHNKVACKMETVLDRVAPPAGTTSICDLTGPPVLLYTAQDQAVGQVLSAYHIIRIVEPGSLALVGLALAGLAAAGRVRGRRD